jgi:hypothetical protein
MIRRIHTFVVIACAVVVVAAVARPGAAAAAELVTETFDTNTDTAGSRWEGLNNRVSPQSFGWSNTNNTGSTVNPPLGGTATGAGELGGTISRAASPPSFYGYNIGSLDLTQDLEVRGVIRYSGGSGGFNLGYFRGASSYGTGGNAANFMGVFFDDAKNSYVTTYDANGARERSDSPYDLVQNVTHAFRIEYRTNGFNPDTIRFTLDGNLFVHAVGINPPTMLPFTHFGLLPTSAAGSSAQIWLDDLTFTTNPTVPEPAALGALAVLGVVARRGRRA